MFAPPVLTKAKRLLDTRSVSRLALDDAYRVVGDHGTYMVITDARAVAHCSCPSTHRHCSHLAAVLLARRAGVPLPVEASEDDAADPFQGLVA